MSGRHQPLHGADSASALDIACPTCDATYTVYETGHDCAREYVDPRDYSCDRCARTIYGGLLRQIQRDGRTWWLCESCWRRERAAA